MLFRSKSILVLHCFISQGKPFTQVFRMKDLTIFIITTDEPSFESCKQSIELQMDDSMCLKVISNTFPMWRAFQRMLDECDTPFFVQVDADMLLYQRTVEFLKHSITKASENTAIVVGWLWDVDVERPILGVKIYNHKICVNFPYEDSVSCEMTQLDRMKKHGFTLDVLDLPKNSETCFGLHYPSQTPEMAFRRWERNMMKVRKLPWMDWLNIYPPRLFRKMIENPSDQILRAKVFGAMSGLSVSLIEDTEADYSAPNENFLRYAQYFCETQSAKHNFVIEQDSDIQKNAVTIVQNLLETDSILKLEKVSLVKNDVLNTFRIEVEISQLENALSTPAGYLSASMIKERVEEDFMNPKTNFDDAWCRQEYLLFFLTLFSNNFGALDLSKAIVFCVDRFDWAFDHISRQVIKHNERQKKGFELYRNDFCFLSFVGKLFDIKTNIVCFWWNNYPLIRGAFANAKIALMMYDHYSWMPVDATKNLKKHLGSSVCIGVGNKKIKECMQALKVTDKVFVLQDGVDFELFPISSRLAEKPVFGWVGNSKIQKSGGYSGDDLKGVKLIQDVCKKLNLELKILDVSETAPVLQSQMFEEFYSQIDCYICASESEGTPNTVFESLACGIPVLSTNVGNVEDVLVPGVNGFYFDRNAKSLESALKTYLTKHKDFSNNRSQIRDSVAFFEWSVKTQNWFVFLNYLLNA